MSSYRQILYHIIIRTKYSQKALDLNHSNELYNYIWGIIKNKKCHLYRINGMEDHIHILSDLHPSMSLADYVRDIKTASSIWLKKSGKFSMFTAWSEGYAALTYSYRDKDTVIEYIKNQRSHHAKVDFKKEFRDLLEYEGIVVDEKYFLE